MHTGRLILDLEANWGSYPYIYGIVRLYYASPPPLQFSWDDREGYGLGWYGHPTIPQGLQRHDEAYDYMENLPYHFTNTKRQCEQRQLFIYWGRSAIGGQTPSHFGRNIPAPSSPYITLLRPHNLPNSIDARLHHTIPNSQSRNLHSLSTVNLPFSSPKPNTMKWPPRSHKPTQ